MHTFFRLLIFLIDFNGDQRGSFSEARNESLSLLLLILDIECASFPTVEKMPCVGNDLFLFASVCTSHLYLVLSPMFREQELTLLLPINSDSTDY